MCDSGVSNQVSRGNHQELQQASSLNTTTRTARRNGQDEVVTVQEQAKPSAIGQFFGFIFRIVTNPMNAAVTIFGLGIGVGLILGDSFRDDDHGNSRSSNSTHDGPDSERRQNGAGSDRGLSEQSRIEELPEHSAAAALLPAQ